MSAAKGNKYNQHGDEPMDAHIHVRITSKQLADFTAKCKSLGKTKTEVILKFVKYYTEHEQKK